MHTNYLEKSDIVVIELRPYKDLKSEYNLDKIIYDLDDKIGILSSRADSLDYIVAVASGLVCSMLDILWVGDFDLNRGREIASDKVDNFVKKVAEKHSHKEMDDLKSAVKYLEDNFHIPSDGNTPDFGGGLQHHLRDFAHHPTIVGLAFSLLTQFTYKSYGTDVDGKFLVVDVPEKSKLFIGKDTSEKIVMGSITWFFHLVSDMAGSKSTVVETGGTGIPGPILALAKEMSAIPIFEDIKIGDKSLSLFLSKLFNGTLLAQHDESETIIKDSILRFDLRAELGVAIELSKQAVPVVANECIVRSFYFIRHLAYEMKEKQVSSIGDMKQIDWETIKPANNPAIARMLTVATGVFTMIDVGEAIASQKYWISINYIGVGRFAVAIGTDINWYLKARNIKRIKSMYDEIRLNTYRKFDDNIYKEIGEDMEMDKLGLTLEQTEILYNIEYYKTLNDINNTKKLMNSEGTMELKKQWLSEWKQYMTVGFSSFLQIEGAELHWYTLLELKEKISKCNPNEPWYRLVLLEAMLFEPYYPLSLETNKKGEEVPSKKYKGLHLNKSGGDNYLDLMFSGTYCKKGYVKRLRKCYDKCLRELNEVLKTVIKTLSITAVMTIVAVATAGAFAPAVAVALVGSNFAGLSGAALTSACLAYLGGGAIAVGGAGMAGGTMAIVGSGAVLGLGVGAGVGGVAGAAGLVGKRSTIMQSAKLLVSVREIFLNDEKDIEFSNSIYEKYLESIMQIEKGIIEIQLKADVAKGEEKKALVEQVKQAKESVEAMKLARKSMLKFKSSFEIGLATNSSEDK